MFLTNGFFYHGTIRKYIIMFGKMFNDINITRFDANSTAVQVKKVPISYGPTEKWLARMRQDPRERQVAMVLPRLSFEIIGMSYAPTRNLNRAVRDVKVNESDSTTYITQQVPVPYDFNILLSAMVATNEDGVQITEQIIPYFRPEYTVSADMIAEMGISRDIPIELVDVSIDDSYEGSFNDSRMIIYNFNFTLKGYLYGPLETKGGVIKRTIIDLTAALEGGPNQRITLTPGLLANGSPTTDSTLSVASNTIFANSNYGYAFDSNTFFDGVDRHNHE
jgi:hypothetical protein